MNYIDLSMNRYWRKAERAMLNHRAAMNRNDRHKAWYWMRYARIYLSKGVYLDSQRLNTYQYLTRNKKQVETIRRMTNEQDKFEASL